MAETYIADETLERITPLALPSEPLPDASGNRREISHVWLKIATGVAGLGLVTSFWCLPAALYPSMFLFGLALGALSKIGFDIKYSAGPKPCLTPYLSEIAGVWFGLVIGSTSGWAMVKSLI